jgi:hypothetical protein
MIGTCPVGGAWISSPSNFPIFSTSCSLSDFNASPLQVEPGRQPRSGFCPGNNLLQWPSVNTPRPEGSSRTAARPRRPRPVVSVRDGRGDEPIVENRRPRRGGH